jgi:hypothetical protein
MTGVPEQQIIRCEGMKNQTTMRIELNQTRHSLAIETKDVR